MLSVNKGGFQVDKLQTQTLWEPESGKGVV